LTKDELKQEATRLGVKIKENFMDDPWENVLCIIGGMILGAALTKMFF
jgi:hypothetical protein